MSRKMDVKTSNNYYLPINTNCSNRKYQYNEFNKYSNKKNEPEKECKEFGNQLFQKNGKNGSNSTYIILLYFLLLLFREFKIGLSSYCINNIAFICTF